MSSAPPPPPRDPALGSSDAPLPGPGSECGSADPSRLDLTRLRSRARIPLSTILVAAELLMDEDLEHAQRLEHLRAIQRGGRRLQGLVDDMADLERMAAGQQHTPLESVGLFEIVSETATLMRFRAERKGVRLLIQIDWPFPEFIVSNAKDLRRILVETCGQAVHNTTRGEVTLRCRMVRAGDRVRVVFQVEDSGPGLDGHDLAHLFDVLPDARDLSRPAGEGLGLIMARGLARELGGDLRAASQLGVGTTIDITIDAGPLEHVQLLEREPALVEVRRALPPPSAEPLRGSILLIDPDPDLRASLARLLMRDGLDVVAVGSGVEALERIFPRRERRSRPEHAGGRRSGFDLVLLDSDLCDRAGDPVASGLRKRGFEARIVGMLPEPLEGRLPELLATGCDAAIEKPLDLRRLRHTLEQLLAGLADDSEVA